MRSLLIILAVLLIGAFNAAAEVHGEIGGGVLYYSGNDNMETFDGDDATTQSFILFHVMYQENDNRTWYFGVPFEDIDLKLKAGVQQKNSLGETDVYLHVVPDADAWENPYAGANREATSVTAFGAGVKHSFNNGYAVEYTYTTIELQDDVSGELYPELARDGQTHSLEVSYQWVPTETDFVIPKLMVVSDDRKGEAQSSTTVGAAVTYMKMFSAVRLMSMVTAGQTTYGADDPIYGKTRTETITAAFVALRKDGFLDIPGVYISGGAIAMGKDANIDFYDADVQGIFLMGGYQF